MRSLLSLSCLLLAACTSAGSVEPDPSGPSSTVSCKPDEYVFCRLSDGSAGLQQCSPKGTSLGPCLCEPGNFEVCTCANKSEGTKRCADDGARYESCECDPGTAGAAGAAGTSGAGGAATGGTAGQSTAGGQGGSVAGAAGAPLGGAAGAGGVAGSGGAVAGSGGAGKAGSSGSSGNTSGGTGGGKAVANDACPGTVVAVSPGSDTVISGTTVGATDQYAVSCASGDGGDVVYQVTSSISGNLTAIVQGQAGLDASLYAWTASCGTGAPAFCANQTAANGVESGTFAVTAAQPVWVVVDSASTDGPFQLTLSVAAPTTVEGDKCPGKPVSLAAGSPTTLMGDTSLAKADVVGDAPCDKTTSTNDVVYAVTPAANGTLTAELTPTAPFNGVLYARSGACTTGAQIGCSAGGGAGVAEKITFPVTAGTTYSVFVDGQTGSSGAYSLALSLSTSSCGDGMVVKGEQCDDANAATGDGCFACKVEQSPVDGDCPGQSLHVFDDTTLVSGTTVGYASFDKGSCGGDLAKERFYQVIPHVTGTLRAEITTASFDTVLYARKAACFGSSSVELACDDVIGNGKELIDVPVQSGTPIWLTVDGYMSASGTYALSLTIF